METRIVSHSKELNRNSRSNIFFFKIPEEKRGTGSDGGGGLGV